MVSIPKFVGLMSCGFLLCLGLSTAAQAGNAASAADELKSGQADQMKGDQTKGGDSERGKAVKGEVLRVEGDTYFVKGQDGKEVRLRIDKNTQIKGLGIVTGDDVVVKLDDQNHVEFISPDRNVDCSS